MDPTDWSLTVSSFSYVVEPQSGGPAALTRERPSWLNTAVIHREEDEEEKEKKEEL